MKPKIIPLLALLSLVALSVFSAHEALADAVNTAPKPNVVGSNGRTDPSVLSTDPQIGTCIFDSTGVAVASATLTRFADATHFPCTILRGAMVDTDASGYLSERRNGLYKVTFSASCTGVTTETGVVAAQISTDGGTTFAAISGASGRETFLTGALLRNISGTGYVSVSQTSASLAAGNMVIALFGSSSGGSTMTCANNGGINVERVDQLQPATYP